MKGIKNVSLVKEQSSPPVYLIVGNVKFWITDPAELEALGFDWDKVRDVDDGALNRFTQKLLHAAPATRPSDKFFDCGDDFDFPETAVRTPLEPGKHYYNCKPSASLVRKDVLVAGWLTGVPHVHTKGLVEDKVEDVHYNLILDAVFLDRMYGPNGLSTALQEAYWPGNPPTPNPKPLAFQPDLARVSRYVPFSSWFLLGQDRYLHCELNAWHKKTTGNFGHSWFVGRGDPPAGWVKPPLFEKDEDAWFPFHPLDPEGTGQPLQEGDYVVMRGALWQDNAHEGDPSHSPPWDGWAEIHPPDWIVRVGSPGPNARVTTRWTKLRVLGNQTGTTDLTVQPDFAPSDSNKLLQVRRWQGLVDHNFSTAIVDRSELTGSSDSVSWHLAVKSRGPTSDDLLKVHLLVEWRETDKYDIVFVDKQLPPGATPGGDGEDWDWVNDVPPSPEHRLSSEQFSSGPLVHRSALVNGMHQHYFWGATSPMTVERTDVLFAMVYLDPDNPPDEVMLQWHTTDWLSRAYWGENLINFGTDGTADRWYMGPLPPTGEWVLLEVSAANVWPAPPPITVGHTTPRAPRITPDDIRRGAGGGPFQEVGTPQTSIKVDGMAFTLFGGSAMWDYTGVRQLGRLR